MRAFTSFALAFALALVTNTSRAQAPPVELKPGQAIRIHIPTSPGNEPGTGITIRIQLESGESGNGGGNPEGGGDGAKPPAADKLTKELADLYKQDDDLDKIKHIQALAQLYRWGAKALRSQSGTAGGFRKALGTQSAALLPSDILLPLRKRVQVELRSVLPSKPDAQLDDQTREAAAKTFDKLASIMDGLASQ